MTTYQYYPQDIYSASGSGKLFGCWTDHVTKFHPGSFYNFEQDNLPLYDLDERTELLWEQLGYPTSSIPGMVLLVSGDADPTAMGCNKNIFADLSSCVKVLPKYLNYPLIIEVANFGELGDLVLRDITMGPSGSLEIINRTTFAIPVVSAIEASGATRVTTGPHTNYTNSLWKDVSSSPGDSVFSFFGNYASAGPKTISGPYVFSSGDNFGNYRTDERARNSYKGFYGTKPALQENCELTRLSVADMTIPEYFLSLSPTVNYLSITGSVYEESAGSEVSEYDPSSFIQATGDRLWRSFTATPGSAESVLRPVFYGNYLNKIVVSNCNGPIYIRGFFCAGDGATSEIGVDISDSTVSLDCLAVDHYVSKGISIKNSNVDFRRDLFVNRCYGLDENGDRKSGLWLTENSNSFDPRRDDSAGIEAINSELFFNTTEEHTTSLGVGAFNAGLYLKMISRNSTGIRLINSIVRGGKPRPESNLITSQGFKFMDILSIEGNANYGIEMENSRFTYDGRLEVFNNTRGVKASNSNFNLEEFTVEYNHIYGIRLDNTEFRYNLNGVSSTDRFDYNSTNVIPQTTSFRKQYTYKFHGNGQHLIMRNSTFRPNRYQGGMEKYFGRLVFLNAHGLSNDTQQALLPGIECNASIAELINATSIREGLASRPAKGAHILATNGSEVFSLGTVSSMCAYIGGEDFPSYLEMKHYAAICAEDNSTITFRGPNVIYDGAVNVLANNNSNIVFEPHKKQNGEFDIEGFTLTDARSHTMIELKAYKSNLVANNNSNIIMEDLGDYNTLWGQADVANTDYDSSTTLQFSPYVSGGFMQIYPNPNEQGDYTLFPQVLEGRGSECRMTKDGDRYYFGDDPWTNDPYALTSVTEGGVCLRALNGSHVRVRNVHFPCGYWNASSTYYDTSAADEYCSRLFIWNVANNSTMHIDHVSVSGAYPTSAGYHGPSAVWVSADGLSNFGLPSSTPDTSTLSVLDFYGEGSGVTSNNWQLPDGSMVTYGQNKFENQGPFRLYVGVDSAANVLTHGGGMGIIQQLFAQGYNPSGPATGNVAASSIYGKLLRVTDEGLSYSGGYYYANEFVKCDPNSILLDESAANLFANAKNGAMGTSNRPQICTIYYAETSSYGDGRSGANVQKGKGFKSCNHFDLLEEN